MEGDPGAKLAETGKRWPLVFASYGPWPKSKDIAFDQSSRSSFDARVEKLANAVGVTLGLECGVRHELFNFKMKAASKTNDSAGDGTTTATVLAREIMKLGLSSVTSGANSVSIKKGIDKIIDPGYISRQLVTNPEKLLVDFENAKVLVTDQKISTIKEIIPLLEKTTQLRAPLLIIAEVVNKLRHDHCDFNCAQFQAKDLGLLIENVSVEQLGTARKITISQNSTTLIADAASEDEIQARIAQLKRELAEMGLDL
ncbi:hypothetical protein Cni_G08760 [Canna indica]|uniref:Uncharacterized protein n=1 Tax=Canna indica TaxID=4628 RepID=A0AAQ3K4M7_9LILI|nr:hypothetical protein Cni_G08760 [Canna indica]